MVHGRGGYTGRSGDAQEEGLEFLPCHRFQRGQLGDHVSQQRAACEGAPTLELLAELVDPGVTRSDGSGNEAAHPIRIPDLAR